MPDPKKTSENITENISGQDISRTMVTDSDMEAVAERYLTLWQDNIKYWVTSPNLPPGK